jgi:membrane dipeptidase
LLALAYPAITKSRPKNALDVCGEDHVGIGTDVPFFEVTEKELAEIREQAEQRQAAGIGAPGENRPPYIPELNTPLKLELVTGALLKRGYSNRIAEKVLGLNFRRAFCDIWMPDLRSPCTPDSTAFR